MEPVEYRWRWVILSLFCFANLTNAAVWISCAAVNIYLQDVRYIQIYDVDSLWVDMCSLVYMIVFVPMVFPTNYILDTKGLRVGVGFI
jgi:FLVCR family MFS transporter 7